MIQKRKLFYSKNKNKNIQINNMYIIKVIKL